MRLCYTLLSLILSGYAHAQDMAHFADSIRQVNHIPELAYAVVSPDSVYEIAALGVTKAGTGRTATLNDQFRIGSNTKAITGLMAAQLVAQQKISWDTRFFDLYPELRAKSNKAYHNVTLLDLLTFRTRLFPYTYTWDKPVKGQFAGSEQQQRYQFAQWCFAQPPVKEDGKDLHFSNLGYVAAGLMLEKVTGKSYEQLLQHLNDQLHTSFAIGQPNLYDTLQTWGHDAALHPEAPMDNYKLNWLMAAGNIRATLPDHVRFIQLQLKGLSGRSALLSKQQFELLHYGRPQFAAGWFWGVDDAGRRYAYNIGNPGTFLTRVCIFGDNNIAFLIFSNVQSDEAEAAQQMLLQALEEKYLK